MASRAQGRTGRAEGSRAPAKDRTRGERLHFHEVDRARWTDLEQLFEERGGPKYCWCMAWRTTSEEARRLDPAGRKAALEKRVRADAPIGLLGYAGERPVAWCSISPRETYRPLGGLTSPEDEPGEVWSLVCFFITRPYRGQGVMRQLLEAAVAHARAKGAAVVEAYPVDEDSPSYRFMGFRRAFSDAGFVEVGRAGTRRHVMRLTLGPG